MGKLLQIVHIFLIVLIFMVSVDASVSSPLTLDINSSVNSTILTDSEISPHSNNRSEYYTFTLTEEKRIVISLESDFYHKLYLLESNGTIIKESSKFDYLNNKIVITLTQGSYIVDVTSVFSDNYGSFTLSLNENIINTKPLILESIVDGEWTVNAAVSAYTSQYANYYTFTLDHRTDILIDLDSNSPYIYLLDSNGSEIAYASGNSVEHAKIVKTLEAGEYQLEVTSTGLSYGLGIYTLRIKINNITTTPIDLNSTVSSVWSISSGVSPRSKTYTNYYTFTLTRAKDISIGIDSDLSIERLYLLDSNNSVIAESYGRRVIIQHLPEGTYTIDTTLSSIGTGNFSLFLKENIISNIPIDLNSSTTENWDQSSGISQSSGGYSNYHTFTLTEQTNIVMSITGTNSILYLLDENGNRDYSVYFSNGSLVGILDAGTYTVEATQSIRRDENYQIEIYKNKVLHEYITIGNVLSNTLSLSDGLSKETHNIAKEYTFTLSKKTDVVFDLNSSIGGARLLLKNDMGSISYIFKRQNFSLEAGTYTLEVTYFGSDENITGDFILGTRENIIERKPILFNSLTQGSWTEESGLTSPGNYVNQYTFTLTEATDVMIKMQSKYAKYIILDSTYHYSYDSNDILFSKTLAEGTYVIDVVIDDWSNIYQTGQYSLLIQADVIQPLPVKVLTTQAVYSHITTITWQQGSNSTVGYKIYLDGVFVVDVDGSQNSYVLGGLHPESEYEYSVIAYNSAGESEIVKGNFKTKKDDFSWLIPINQMIMN